MIREEKEKKEDQFKKEPEEPCKEIKPEKETKPEDTDYKEKWLRALAEYDNLKKRVERERIETIRFSNQFLMMDLFPIMDSFDSAMSSIEKSNDKESFLKGLKMLQREFHKILESNGLKKIETVGKKFDPNFHQAEEEIPTDKFPAGVIAEEIRSGYVLNERLLRPAIVKVSKGIENVGRGT